MENLLKKAQSHFDKMIENSTEKQRINAIQGFGLGAATFAMRYLQPKENPELYKQIYNIYFQYFTDLKTQQEEKR